jgi:hypothetical protein
MKLPRASSRSRWISALLLGTLAAAAHAARAPIELAAFSKTVELTPTVAMSNLAKECSVASLVSERVGEQLQRNYRNMKSGDGLPKLAGEERGLKLSVVNMFGLGGGNYSGPKWMVIRAEVVGSEGVVSARDFRRVSVASFSGLFMGTCHVMGKVAAKTGADIRQWLRQGAPGTPIPAMDEEDDVDLRSEQAPAPAEPTASDVAAPPASAASS